MMRVLINSVAASSSGALGILQEYYQRAVEDASGQYIFLVSIPELPSTSNVKVLRYPWVKRSWLHRIVFDWVIAPIIVKRERPERIISLQNLKMKFVSAPQTIYEHNCIPPAFCKYRFNLLQEPILWIRQNVLGRMIQRSLKTADKIIVQAEWMRRRCIEKLGIDPEKVIVEPPKISSLPSGSYKRTLPISFLYPATHMPFKRHDLIIDAAEKLVDIGLGKKFKVVFTLSGDESKYASALKQKVLTKGLPVEFAGWQARDALYTMYAQSVLLFSSELESFPLPLIEAASIGAPIVAPDLEYAREALDGYCGASFFIAGDSASLAEAMGVLIDG